MVEACVVAMLSKLKVDDVAVFLWCSLLTVIVLSIPRIGGNTFSWNASLFLAGREPISHGARAYFSRVVSLFLTGREPISHGVRAYFSRNRIKRRSESLLSICHSSGVLSE
ncbi:hypothetical protein EZS27_020919 [termite gut metagenome]|uniref:Uncharacterized protein n=1 Tax=termite gut metagenome TaxID=433724 RepID=A0A5J4RB43_9ZZZZ